MENLTYTQVLTFNKHEYYNLNDLKFKTKDELMEMVKNDPDNCRVYSIQEFQQNLNNFKPYDYLVWHIFV